MEEIPIAEHGISRAIFSTLLNYPVSYRNGKIMLTIYRNKISKLTKVPVTPPERCWSVPGAVKKIHHRS